MDAELEGLEVEPARGGDHDLAVEHAPLGQRRPQGVGQLGKVPGQGLLVAAADHHLVAVAEHDPPEPVPLGLVHHPAGGRQLPGQLGQHRLDGGHDGQVHEAH